MALLFMDGFEHYATADIDKKWTAVTSVTIGSNTGRRGGFGAYLNSTTDNLSKTLPSSYSTIIVGFAYKPTAVNANGHIIVLREGTTNHISLRVNTSGKLEIIRDPTSAASILATSNTTLSANTWYYIELKATISDSPGGATEVKINGSTDSGLTLTSTDTRNGGTSGVVDRVFFGYTSGAANSSTFYLDDIYVCDTSGSTNNNFLGDCRVDTIFPSGAGNYTDFTPSTGSNYTCVDESAPNTTDYVSSATSGHRDSYAFGDLAGLSSQTVYGVQVNAYSQKSDAGARSLGTMARLSSTNSDGTGVALPTSYSYISQVYETDPASAAWTETNVNSAEFGVKVTA